ncbi:MAG: hypothetical protein G01um101420_905 [Parcubacteria group bacterium Gr01-1014_20]|nr:MAG: hypothetical protein G01um101420_905 [Parcubacteria group bacterium Gr01-1014_20]
MICYNKWNRKGRFALNLGTLKKIKNFKMKKLGLFLLLSVLVFPFLAAAQLPTPAPEPTDPGPVDSGQDIVDLINQFLFWLATIFWIAAAGFIFYAAFLYLTAAGDAEKVKTASHALLYGVIAIAVGLMAYGLPVLVRNVLGGN